MTRSAEHHIEPRPWMASAGLVALVLGSTLAGLRNLFVQDDYPIIAVSNSLHSLAHPWVFFTRAYWPPPFPPELYRPLTSLILAAEWVIGHGSPMVFRLGSMLFYLLATFAVWRLARLLLPAAAAWLAAAWFAVHPVHVEAVAVGVNQAELAVGALLTILTAHYVSRRREGVELGRGDLALLSIGYLMASLFKESGLMFPALLVAAELTVIHDRRPWRERLTRLRPLFLALLLIGLAVIEARSLVLAGNTRGTFTAEAIENADLRVRALTMLGVVPEWARLFLWPEHLRADYSPSVILAATSWGWPQTLGAVILVAALATAWLCRRRLPVVTFGILWIGIALFPVSNVLIPTGIILAERTLFLATVGLVVGLTGPLATLGQSVLRRGSVARIAVATSVAVLLGMGLTRSLSRQMVWRDMITLWHQTLIDAPESYRAHHAYAQLLFGVGARRSAEAHYRRAIQLFPRGWPVQLDYADRLRLAGFCQPAIVEYRRILQLRSDQHSARAGLIACLIYVGDYAAARRESELGVGYGFREDLFRQWREIADSAERVHAPAGTVRLPPPPQDSLIKQGMPPGSR